MWCSKPTLFVKVQFPLSISIPPWRCSPIYFIISLISSVMQNHQSFGLTAFPIIFALRAGLQEGAFASHHFDLHPVFVPGFRGKSLEKLIYDSHFRAFLSSCGDMLSMNLILLMQFQDFLREVLRCASLSLCSLGVIAKGAVFPDDVGCSSHRWT